MNPFSFDSAHRLSTEDFLKVYIQEEGLRRLLESNQNLVAVGARGSGKTSFLFFSRFAVEVVRARQENRPPRTDQVGVYVPSNGPFLRRSTSRFYSDAAAAQLDEHYLVSVIIIALLEEIKDLELQVTHSSEVEFLRSLTEWPISYENPLRDIKGHIYSLVRTSQLLERDPEWNGFLPDPITYSFALIPVVNFLRNGTSLGPAKLSIMVDDAQALSGLQRSLLNSWMSYRDHDGLSFKICLPSEQHFFSLPAMERR